MVARILTAGLVLALLTQADETQAPPSDPPHERSPDPKSDPWVIGVDDELDIWVYEEPELNKSVRVRPDGRISMPYIDDVVVAGKTPEEVRDVLIQRLTGYVKSPRITVIVKAINSFKVFFLGEVNTPGEKQFQRPMRVLQAVAAAGGPSDYSKKQITIIREEFGIERRIEIDYKKLLEGAAGQENLYLKPGDTVIFK